MKTSHKSTCTALLAMPLFTFASLPALAADSTWTAGGDATSWSDNSNWSSNAPGATSGTSNTDTATFNSSPSGGLNVTVDGYRNLRQLLFETAPGAYTFSAIAGGKLHLTGRDISAGIGRIYITNTVTSDNTPIIFNVPIVLEAGNSGLQLFAFDNRATKATSPLLINSNVSGGTTSEALRLTIEGANTGANEISGIISDGGAAGGLSLVKGNNGAWILSGANTFSGGVTIQQGGLHINNNSALGTGTLALQSTGAVSILNSSGSDINLTTNNNQLWDASFNFTIGANDLNLGTGSVTLNKTITIRSQYTTTGKLIVGGNISDGGGNYDISKITDMGELVLNGNLQIGGNLTVSRGTVTLAGINTQAETRVGGSSSHVGQLNINSAQALGSGDLILQNGGTAQIDNTSGAAVTVSTTNAQVWNNTLNFIGSNDLDLGAGAVSLGSIATANRTVSTTAGILTVGGVISDGTDGVTPTKNLIKTGGGTLRLDGDNAYTGTTSVSAGTLIVNGNHAQAGAYTVASGAKLGGSGFIETASNANVTISAGGKLSPGDILGTDSLTLDLGTGHLDIAAAVNAANTQSLLFTLGAPATSDKIVLSNAMSALVIGTGKMEFDDFVFSTTGGFTPASYTLFQTEQIISGSLGSNLTGLVGGYNATLTLSGDNKSILLSVVPEPSTALLFMLAGSVLVTFSQRRKTRK